MAKCAAMRDTAIPARETTTDGGYWQKRQFAPVVN
jgi:hypothetical protein